MTVESMKKPQEPQFDMDEFEDTIMTTYDKDHFVTIKFEGYDYDGAFRIVKLSVRLGNLEQYHFDFLQDQIIEAIALRINKSNVVLETKIEYL